MTLAPPIAHLVEDRDDTLDGTAATALFSPCRTYRYRLTRTWDGTRPQAVFIMLNPSTADAFVEDPTIRRCLGFARTWGCGGLAVLNAFALRATNPRDMDRHPDPCGPDNDRVIIDTLLTAHGPVVAAWGADRSMVTSKRAQRLINLIHTGGIEPVALAVTKDGHPRHPLYVRADVTPRPYPDAGAYTAAMNRMAAA